MQKLPVSPSKDRVIPSQGTDVSGSSESTALDRRIALEKSSIARQWSRVVAQQDGLFNTPEWKTVSQTRLRSLDVWIVC